MSSQADGTLMGEGAVAAARASVGRLIVSAQGTAPAIVHVQAISRFGFDTQICNGAFWWATSGLPDMTSFASGLRRCLGAFALLFGWLGRLCAIAGSRAFGLKRMSCKTDFNRIII